jgi:hypothetical protein
MKGRNRSLPGVKWGAAVVGLAVILGTPLLTQAQAAGASYPAMAAIEQYRMPREAEIKLARTAAPESISHDAEILILGEHGFETAVKGKNGFVCTVQRGWAAGLDDPQFWNPKVRAPICFNAAAARSYLPRALKKTEWALAGLTKAQIAEKLKTAFDKKELAAVEAGAMCYMMSKDGYLSDRDGHWHSHVMLFVPVVDPNTWGVDAPDSPLLGAKNEAERVTIFLLPVRKWSDGTESE